MAEIDVTIDRRQISLKVDDGQEAQIKVLAESLTEQIRDLRRQTPGAVDSNILLLTALILKSELAVAQEQMLALQDALAELKAASQIRETLALETDARLATQIATILQSIEGLADSGPKDT